MKNAIIAEKRTSVFWVCVFVLYLLFLLFIVILKFRGGTHDIVNNMARYQIQRQQGDINLNLIPFKQIAEFLGNAQYGHAMYNLLGNIVPFIPMGVLIPRAVQKCSSFRKAMFICLGVIVLIEIFQFFSLTGVCDIDDVILNMTGCLVGYAIHYCIKFLTQKRGTAKA